MFDKRRFLRFNVPLRIELHGCGGSDLSAHGQMVDFSRQGLRISLPGAFPCSEESSAQIRTVLPKNDTPVEFGVRIKWLRSSDSAWEAGCAIEQIDPGIKSELLDYIYNSWVRNTADKKNESK